MNQPSFLQRYLPHILAVLGLLVLSIVYFSPVLSGKTLALMDVQQASASAQEIRELAKATGQKPLWTDALFSGMPAYMIDFDYPHIYIYKAITAVQNVLPAFASLVFIMMASAYLLLVVLGCNPWLAVLGAAAYGLGSFSIISLEAGHVSKILALGYGAGVLAGLVLCLRGRYWLGAAVTGVFLSMEFGANHIQITYYLFLTIGLYLVFEGVALLRAGRSRQLLFGLVAFGLASALGAGSFGKRLLVLNQYTKETIRGTSELTAKTTNPDGKSSASESKGGLDKEYAFSYSYGKAETLTLLIPNLYGGASGGGLSTSSDFYKALVGRGVEAGAAKEFAERGAPTYWGDQPAVGGPAYAGAALLFLFVLSLFVLRGPVRWWLLSAAGLLIVLAWGKNLLWFNELLFDYLPYLNKFRAMTMALCLAQLFMAVGAALGLQAIVDQKLTFGQLKQPLAISLGLTAGVALVLAVMGGAFFDFQTALDLPRMQSYFGDAANEFKTALMADRQSLLRADAFRSVILIVLAAGLVWALLTGKLKPGLFYPLIVALVVFDLFAVDKRFLNSADFITKTQAAEVFSPTAADHQIMQDRSLGYRVFDQTPDFMSSNRASYFHRSVGGYHAAKLRRYNELMTYAFQANTLGILNMLNVKYVIQQPQPTDPNNPQQPTGPQALPNPQALGAAWFVGTVVPAADADAELALMKALNPRDSAVVGQSFMGQLSGLPATLDHTGSSVQLTSYHGDKLTYSVDAAREGVVVFSEVYYRGQEDWQAFIDGKPAPHFRADYVLRAMRVPAGKHTVEFRFDPPLAKTGDTIDLICNVLLIGLVGFVAFSASRGTGSVPAGSAPVDTPAVPEAPVGQPLTDDSKNRPKKR